MLRRARTWIVAALAALIAVATVSWSPAVTIRIADESGAPASDAYVRYHYEGTLINLVHPVTYVARGSVILKADADGRITIPARIHFRAPLPVSAPPHVFIDHVYVPRLHNAFGPIARRTMSRPGVFTLDERQEQVTVADVSRQPESWEISLRYLFDCIRGTISRHGSRTAAAASDARTAAHARELIDHLRREYSAFVEKYGQTARARPPEAPGGSEVDRRLWREQIDAQLARDPLWGPFVERAWRSNFTELKALEASLK